MTQNSTNEIRACSVPYLAQNRTVKYGYARVSTDDQNADMQRAARKKDGREKILTDDGKSGATTNRPQLQHALKSWRPAIA
jgi:DNA invertase Pin-like site-specific DNA recombinase